MNKNLYNWLDALDAVQGQPVHSSIDAINKERVRQGYKKI